MNVLSRRLLPLLLLPLLLALLATSNQGHAQQTQETAISAEQLPTASPPPSPETRLKWMAASSTGRCTSTDP